MEKKKLESYLDAMLAARTRKELEHTFKYILLELGFEYFSWYVLSTKDFIIYGKWISNYLFDWLFRYAEQNYFSIDPVVLGTHLTQGHLLWRDVLSCDLKPKQFQLFHEAYYCGLRAGATLYNDTLYRGRTMRSLLSVAGRMSNTKFDHLFNKREKTLTVVSEAFNMRTMQLAIDH